MEDGPTHDTRKLMRPDRAGLTGNAEGGGRPATTRAYTYAQSRPLANRWSRKSVAAEERFRIAKGIFFFRGCLYLGPPPTPMGMVEVVPRRAASSAQCWFSDSNYRLIADGTSRPSSRLRRERWSAFTADYSGGDRMASAIGFPRRPLRHDRRVGALAGWIGLPSSPSIKLGAPLDTLLSSPAGNFFFFAEKRSA